MENFEEYLQPTEFLDYDKKKVKEKALQIIKDLKTDKEKAIALFCRFMFQHVGRNVWFRHLQAFRNVK